jgi:hypothetical protein
MCWSVLIHNKCEKCLYKFGDDQTQMPPAKEEKI